MAEDLISDLEKRRKFDRNFFLGALVISAGILGYVSQFLPTLWTIFVAGVLALLNINIFYLLHRHFKRRGKALFLTSLAEEFQLNFSPSHAFEVGSVMEHGIVPPYSVKETEDGFTSKKLGFPIAFQEVTLKKIEEDPREKKRYTIPIFQGLMIKVSLKKRLDFHTIIIPNKFLRPTVEAGSIPHNKGFQEVNLVSNKFTEKYKVYSTNQVESRVLFDPLFIERFMELGKHLDAKWLEASFRNNELLIMAQYKKDHFEIGSILRPVMEDDIEKVREELKHILAMSEMLKHNTYFERE